MGHLRGRSLRAILASAEAFQHSQVGRAMSLVGGQGEQETGRPAKDCPRAAARSASVGRMSSGTFPDLECNHACNFPAEWLAEQLEAVARRQPGGRAEAPGARRRRTPSSCASTSTPAWSRPRWRPGNAPPRRPVAAPRRPQGRGAAPGPAVGMTLDSGDRGRPRRVWRHDHAAGHGSRQRELSMTMTNAGTHSATGVIGQRSNAPPYDQTALFSFYRHQPGSLLVLRARLHHRQPQGTLKTYHSSSRSRRWPAPAWAGS